MMLLIFIWFNGYDKYSSIVTVTNGVVNVNSLKLFDNIVLILIDSCSWPVNLWHMRLLNFH